MSWSGASPLGPKRLSSLGDTIPDTATGGRDAVTSGPPLDVPQTACVHQLFEKQVIAHPGRLAVQFEDDTSTELTYLQLNSNANAIAGVLVEGKNLKCGEAVGVCLNRGVALFTTILGIWKAGGCYVALDPDFPVDRLAYTVEAAKLRIIITEDDLKPFVHNMLDILTTNETTTTVKKEKAAGRLVTRTVTTVVESTPDIVVSNVDDLQVEGAAIVHSAEMDEALTQLSNNSLSHLSRASRFDGGPGEYRKSQVATLSGLSRASLHHEYLAARTASATGRRKDARSIKKGDEWEISSDDIIFRRKGLKSSDRAYVIFTSGSTGNPKGVELEHVSVVNFLLSMQVTPGMSMKDTILSITTICFDIHVLEMWLPLVCGARSISVSRKTVKDGIALAKLMDKMKPTVVQATPAHWSILIEAGWSGDPNVKILIGGEALPVPLSNRLRGMCGQLWNMYGPTEATVWCTLKHIDSNLTKDVSIGRPCHNVTAYILDVATLQPVEGDHQGELYIGGAQSARGYLGRDDLTKERFVPDPFRGDGELMYRTGDLAKWVGTGVDTREIICLGRADHQVKINGYRIELGEIEAALLTHNAVDAAVVDVYSPSAGEKKLVAYLTYTPDALSHPPSSGTLRDHVAKRVCSYMVPGAFVVLDAMPLLPNNKVNRKALPSPSSIKEEIKSKNVVEPRTQVETSVLQMATSLLASEVDIGTATNLFSVGGNSLFALRLRNAIQEQYNIEVPVTSILQIGTVAGISASIDRLLPSKGHGNNSSDHKPVSLASTSDRSSTGSDTSDISLDHLMDVDETSDDGGLFVRLRTGSPDRTPMYLIHPAGGFVFPYMPLVNELESDIPIIGVQDPLLLDTSTTAEYRSVEDMATLYVSRLIAHQPDGPLILAGWSLGGTICFEMARQLAEVHERTVERVILIDTMLHEQFHRFSAWFHHFTKGAALVSQQLRVKKHGLRKGGKVVQSKLFGFLASAIEKTVGGGDDGGTATVGGGDLDPDLLADPSAGRMVKILEAHMKAASRYEAEPYDGRVLVLRCVEQPDTGGEDQVMAWIKVAPNAQIVDVPGNHYTIVNLPHVQTLAAHISENLDLAEFQKTGMPREAVVRASMRNVAAFAEMDEYEGLGLAASRLSASARRTRGFSIAAVVSSNALTQMAGWAEFEKCQLVVEKKVALQVGRKELEAFREKIHRGVRSCHMGSIRASVGQRLLAVARVTINVPVRLTATTEFVYPDNEMVATAHTLDLGLFEPVPGGKPVKIVTSNLTLKNAFLNRGPHIFANVCVVGTTEQDGESITKVLWRERYHVTACKVAGLLASVSSKLPGHVKRTHPRCNAGPLIVAEDVEKEGEEKEGE